MASARERHPAELGAPPARRSRGALRWVAEAALLAVALVAVGSFQAREVRRGALPIRSLATLDGAAVDLSSLRGKPAMIAVWAPWCGVCAVDARNVSWVRALAGDRATVTSLATHYRSLDEVRVFAREHEIDYPILLGGRDLTASLGVTSFPTFLFVDADGRVVHAAVGYTTTLGMLVRLLLS